MFLQISYSQALFKSSLITPTNQTINSNTSKVTPKWHEHEHEHELMSCSAREAAEKLLRGSTGSTVLCSRLLCLEKLFSALGFDHRPLLLCFFVKQSNFVLHFLYVLCLLLLQIFLLKILFNYSSNIKTTPKKTKKKKIGKYILFNYLKFCLITLL